MAKKKVEKNVNMELWDSVCETNPAITKRVSTRGGFTSIDAQAQIKRATELWGSFGNRWGLRELDFKDKCDSTFSGIALVAVFYYPATTVIGIDAGTKTPDKLLIQEASFPIASDMPYKPNDDCFKKLQTDCITKALSRLGFNSDVFEGKYDDNKYVAEMKKKYDKPVVKETVKSTKAPVPNVGEKKILQIIADKYVNRGCPADTVVSMKKLESAVLLNFGKFPTKESSIDKVIDAIPVKDVIEKNDFIEGIN